MPHRLGCLSESDVVFVAERLFRSMSLMTTASMSSALVKVMVPPPTNSNSLNDHHIQRRKGLRWTLGGHSMRCTRFQLSDDCRNCLAIRKYLKP